MVKKAYIIAGIALVVVLLAVGAFVYEQGMVPGGSQASPSPTASTAFVPGQQVTAFEAMALAESNGQFKDWKDGKTNVSVTLISSNFCGNGKSDRWTVDYASDSSNAVVNLDNGSISVAQADAGQGIPPLAQRITTTGIQDSDKACSIAQDTLNDAGVYSKGLASVKLTAKSPGTYVWDVSYTLTNGGYYVVRIDASNGTVVGSDQVG